MRARVGLAIFFLAPSALAGSTFEEHGKFSLPLLLGGDVAIAPSSTSGGFVPGVRPEYVFAWVDRSADTPRAIGVGPYVEVMGSTGTSQVWLGGGASVVGYFGYFGVAISGGLDVDWFHAVPNASPVVGLFLGFRAVDSDYGVDFPYGIRVDLRPAVGPLPTTVVIAAQLDLAGPPIAFIGALAHALSH